MRAGTLISSINTEEVPVRIPVEHGHLEAALKNPEGTPVGAAVLCHPHPLHGGTMHTKAVFRAAQALNEAGLQVLRFNFRGVGTSTGSYDEGEGEREDVRAALEFMEAHSPRLPLILGGFSFGSAVAARVGVDDPRVRALLAMGLPLDMHDFSFLAQAHRPVLVVQGEEDEFGDGERAAQVAEELGDHVTLHRIPKSNHYFDDHFDELKNAIRSYFVEGPGGRAIRGDSPPPGVGATAREEEGA